MKFNSEAEIATIFYASAYYEDGGTDEPLLEAVSRLRDSSATGNAVQSDTRLAALEAEVSRLQVEVQRLSEVEAFTRQLTQGGAGKAV